MGFKQFFKENESVKDIDFTDVEEYYEDGDTIIEEDDWKDTDVVSEIAKNVKVVRGGKVIVKKKSTKKGYKIVDGQEVKMDPTELKARKKGAKKAAKKRKAKQSQTNRKRAISAKKRSQTSLNTQFKGGK